VNNKTKTKNGSILEWIWAAKKDSLLHIRTYSMYR